MSRPVFAVLYQRSPIGLPMPDVLKTLHRQPEKNAFDHQRQIADLDYLTGSHAAMTSLAEQYVGFPPEVSFDSAGL